MSELLPTVIVATLLVLAAVFALSIGFLLTGKHKIKGGSCGRAPSKKMDDSCGTDATCNLCKKDDDDKH